MKLIDTHHIQCPTSRYPSEYLYTEVSSHRWLSCPYLPLRQNSFFVNLYPYFDSGNLAEDDERAELLRIGRNR